MIVIEKNIHSYCESQKMIDAYLSIEEKRNYNFMKFEFAVVEGIYGWYEKLIKQI